MKYLFQSHEGNERLKGDSDRDLANENEFQFARLLTVVTILWKEESQLGAVSLA